LGIGKRAKLGSKKYQKPTNQFFFTLNLLKEEISTYYECESESIFVDNTQPKKDS